MGAILMILGVFILLLFIGALVGTVIGLPILIKNVKETRRKQAEEAARK